MANSNGHRDQESEVERLRKEATIDGKPIPEDIDLTLADPDEERMLRTGEVQLAANLDRLAKGATKALRRHDRVAAAMVLAQLAQVCAHGQKAEVAAINAAMKKRGSDV